MTDQTSAQVEDKPLVPGTPEYDIAMATKAREARGDTTPAENQTPADEAPKPPEGVPEKFWNPETGQVDTEKLLASYKELEANQGKTTPDASQANEQATKEVVEKAGLDWTELQNKVATTGKIEDADYEALDKVGIPKALVDDIISMRKDQFEREQNAAVEYAGGEEATNELLTWASKNLKPEEVNSFNEILAGEHWRVAIDSLKSRRAASSKTAGEPQLTSGRSSGGAVTVGYTSKEEMKLDMRNPLYFERGPKGDAFRAQVMNRAKLSGGRHRQ